MSVVKPLHFPVSTEWLGGRLVDSEAPGKRTLRVATPPALGGVGESHWSPEELLVNAVASCYTQTLASVARRLRVPVRTLEIRAAGHVERDGDGGDRFMLIELEVELETEPETVAVAQRAAEVAERRCTVSGALAVPVYVNANVRAPGGERAPELVA